MPDRDALRERAAMVIDRPAEPPGRPLRSRGSSCPRSRICCPQFGVGTPRLLGRRRMLARAGARARSYKPTSASSASMGRRRPAWHGANPVIAYSGSLLRAFESDLQRSASARRLGGEQVLRAERRASSQVPAAADSLGSRRPFSMQRQMTRSPAYGGARARRASAPSLGANAASGGRVPENPWQLVRRSRDPSCLHHSERIADLSGTGALKTARSCGNGIFIGPTDRR